VVCEGGRNAFCKKWRGGKAIGGWAGENGDGNEVGLERERGQGGSSASSGDVRGVWRKRGRGVKGRWWVRGGGEGGGC